MKSSCSDLFENLLRSKRKTLSNILPDRNFCKSKTVSPARFQETLACPIQNIRMKLQNSSLDFGKNGFFILRTAFSTGSDALSTVLQGRTAAFHWGIALRFSRSKGFVRPIRPAGRENHPEKSVFPLIYSVPLLFSVVLSVVPDNVAATHPNAGQRSVPDELRKRYVSAFSASTILQKGLRQLESASKQQSDTSCHAWGPSFSRKVCLGTAPEICGPHMPLG